jgi:general secretion pathway protein I
MNAEVIGRRHGFTLVEVLVALAIVALGLIGVFAQVSQSAASAGRLRDKTLADWVALNKLTELRLSGVFPRVGTSSDDIQMAGTKWHWEMKVSDTEGLRRADVTVSLADTPDRPLALASGFVTQRPASPPASASGWPPLGEETDSAAEDAPLTPSPTPGGAPPAEGGAEE